MKLNDFLSEGGCSGFKNNPCNRIMKNAKRMARRTDLFSILKLLTPVFLLWSGGFIEKMIF